MTLQRAKSGRPGRALCRSGCAASGRRSSSTGSPSSPRSATTRSRLSRRQTRARSRRFSPSACARSSSSSTAERFRDGLPRRSACSRASRSSSPTARASSSIPEPLLGEADSGRLDDDLTDVLVALGEAAADRSRGVLIAVDEVQYLSEEELSALIVAIHRSTQLNLPLVVVGAGLPQLPGLAGEARSYSERLFEFPEIGSLDDADARAASRSQRAPRVSRSRTTHSPRWSAPRTAIRIFSRSGVTTSGITPSPRQFPSATSARLSHSLSPPSTATSSECGSTGSLPRSASISALWPISAAVPHRSGDIAAKLGVRVESVGPRRSGLIRKGMVYSPAHGDTAFTVPLFDDFLRRVMP